MERAASNRIKRIVTALAVMLAHVALVWFIMQARLPRIESELEAEPVIATLIDKPRSVSFEPVPIRVETENVLHLERLAPNIPDVTIDVPEPPTVAETVPQPASNPVAGAATSGANGDARESSGASGGAPGVTVIRRVIPRYPARAARNHQEGSTTVRIRVGEDGSVKEVKVARSSGSAVLDTAAVDAARRWQFSRSPPGSAPEGLWVQTDLRFVSFRFVYSLIGDNAADGLHEEQVKAGIGDAMVPGSQQALERFIAAVGDGTFRANLNAEGRAEIAKMRAALAEWGKVQSIEYTGAMGAARWMSYPIESDLRLRGPQPTVEVSWSTFEVHHQHGTSEWLIAVDRKGTVWNARASPSPWM